MRQRPTTSGASLKACVLWLLASACLATGLLAADEGQEIYAAACASCHGTDGGGLPAGHPNLESFSAPPTSFLDGMFVSTEPFDDWMLVVQYGGSALGLSDQMPAYGEVYDEQQLRAVVTYIKSLTPLHGYPPGELSFLRPIRTIKPFPENEALVIGRYDDAPDPDETSTLRTTLYYGARFGKRAQYEIKATSIDPRSGTSHEEVELGIKYALFDDIERSLLLGAGLEVEIPIDSEESEVAVPWISVAQGLGDWTLQTGLRLELPFDDTGAGAAEVSSALHYMHTLWPRRVFPGLELRAVQPFKGGHTFVSVIPQAVAGLTRGGHVGLGLGIEAPLSDEPWDYRAHLFLTWDFADGSLFAGW